MFLNVWLRTSFSEEEVGSLNYEVDLCSTCTKEPKFSVLSVEEIKKGVSINDGYSVLLWDKGK